MAGKAFFGYGLSLGFLGFMGFMATVPVSGAAERAEIRLDAAGVERDARLINLRFNRTEAAITLDDIELIEDDAPATGVPEGMELDGKQWIEDLRKGIVIKKILLLDNAAAFSGRLVFKGIEVKGNTEPLHISINGARFVRPPTTQAAPFARQYTDYSPNDRWFYVDLPVGALRRGENEVLLWAESDAVSWRVLIALEKEFGRGSTIRPHHPNRSMKSSDSGKTWSDSGLGPLGSVDGEYSIRISLDRHVKKGEYVSPVMDMIDGPNPFKRLVKIGRPRLAVDARVPDGTSAGIFVRFGANPWPDDPSWTPWAPLGPGGGCPDPGGRRYVQWRAELSTANPLLSPIIRGFELDVEYEPLSPNIGLGLGVRAVRNGRVVRSSYPFGYENLLHPELERYRKNAELDKIIEGATGEFEVMMRLLNWAYRIPVTSDRYSWNWNDVVKLEKGEEGMPRLQKDYKARRRDAMCLYSNQALIGALLACGFQARHINIHSEAMSGHEVTEAWSNEFNKWFYLDATRDYYYFDPGTGVPLNLLELHDLMAFFVPRVETWRRPFGPECGPAVAAQAGVGIREGNNPFSVGRDGRHLLETMGHFRIIPRNDFLTNPLPVPVHQGATMWGWDGFLNHYDEKFPRRREYQRYSDRALDFYEPLNQAEISLEETADSGLLTVKINTFTPGFDAFLCRLNGGEWTEQRRASWTWALRPGKNTLEARVRNVRGVRGPASELEVTYNP